MAGAFDVDTLRAQFPLLSRSVHGKPLIYFDSANTAQKPVAAIEAVDDYYRSHNANVSRAVHLLAEEATALYEGARTEAAALIGAAESEIVLTSGTTMALNLVAASHGPLQVGRGDAILLSGMEHHANIVPWQLLAERVGARIVVAPVTEDGTLDLQALDRLLAPPVKLLGLAHVSNVLGTINPIAAICAMARARGITTVIDGSQAVPHLPVDVRQLGCDFYAWTGHKLFGPTGTGVLWGRAELLAAMPPLLGGGEMIDTVDFEQSVYAPPPRRFEAGTPNIAGFVGLAAAIRWFRAQDLAGWQAHEEALGARLLAGLRTIPGVRLLGEASARVPVYSFVIDGAHAHDLAMLLDTEGVAIRSGQHCAHPLLKRFGVPAAARASLAAYNTAEEVDCFLVALERQRRLLTA
ncbi:MAG: SufS family cysteine desulfurase [Xanthomonadales bacterium]|nr:SufS family cysteine desulfurase [Xanthomonadales bacterium]